MTTSAIDFGYLRSVVMNASGNLIDPSRDYLFESRLQGILRAKGWQSLDQLVIALRTDSGELQRSVAEAMTINETSFFRDSSTFDLLRTELLPALIERRAREKRLRFWSAASSSGQEAYSIAIMLRESFPRLADWSIEIVGTDLSAEMVSRASAGRYQRIEINRGLPARMLLKYFVRVDEGWQVNRDIASLCRFQKHNLTEPLRLFWNFDVIFLRNVLIYFPTETRRQVLLHMHKSLARDGAFFLGLSEQPQMDSHWRTHLGAKTVWYQPI